VRDRDPGAAVAGVRHEAVWALLALAALGCASAGGPGLVGDPRLLEAGAGPEAEPLPDAAFEAPGAFRGSVPAQLLAAPQRDGDAWTLALGIGSAVPVECRIHDGDLDLAWSLARASEAQLDALAPRVGGIDVSRIANVDAGALAGALFAGIERVYRTSDGERFGQMKHLMVSKARRAVHCMHDEVGYAKSFRRVVEALVGGLVFAEPAAEPPYEEIATLSANGRTIGAIHASVTREPDGSLRLDTRKLGLIAMAPTTLRATDETGNELAREDGSLLRQELQSRDNGEVATQLALAPHPDGGWDMRGTFRSKRLESRIRSDAPLSSSFREAQRLADALATTGVGAEVRASRWLPSVDPTSLTEQSVRIVERLPDGNYATRSVVGGIEGSGVLDPSGGFVFSEVEIGHIQMRSERVFRRGSF
jgi:hypothetical protein